MSSIYVFFHPISYIKYVEGHCIHVFECVAKNYKEKHGQDVYCFLDKGQLAVCIIMPRIAWKRKQLRQQ